MATITLDKNLVDDLLCAALDIVGDFHSYGEVLQQDNEGGYGPDSGIETLSRIAHQVHSVVQVSEKTVEHTHGYKDKHGVSRCCQCDEELPHKPR